MRLTTAVFPARAGMNRTGPTREYRSDRVPRASGDEPWRVLEWSGHVLGLDWPAVRVLLDAAGGALDAGLLRGLRVMEREVVRVWRGRRD